MVDEEKPRKITGRHMFAALVEAGLIHDGDNARRVIIDIACDAAVVVHVERYGDERLLRLTRDLAEHRDSVAVRDTYLQVQGEKEGATTVGLIAAGFTPESVRDAVETRDLSRLRHRGSFWIQLEPPGKEG